MNVIRNLSFAWLISLLGSTTALAGIFHFQSDTYLSQGRGDDLKIETPFFEAFNANYLNEEQRQQFDFNFGLYYDFSRQNYQVDLQQLDGSFGFADDRGHISLGRSFHTYHLIKASTVDSVSLDYSFLGGRLKTGVMAGALRQMDLDHGSSGALVTSLYSDYQAEDVFPWSFGTTLESRDFTSLQRTHQYWGKVNTRKEWATWLHPEILASVEHDLQLSNSFRNELGLNLYPSADFMYGLRAQNYNMDRTEGFEDPIFSLFALGEVNELALVLGKSYARWYTGVDFGYDQYKYGTNSTAKGQKAQWLLRWTGDLTRLENSVFYMDSYGGSLVGNRLAGQLPLDNRFKIDFNNEYVTYKKITSENNNAVSSRLGLSAKWNQMSLWLAGELNSNNFYSQDWRVVTQVTIYDWKEL